MPSGSGVVVQGAQSYHATVRNTWPDGSAKFALVAGRVNVSAGGTTTMIADRGTASTGTEITEANFIASGITASLAFAGNTVNLSSLLGVTAAGHAAGTITAGRVRTLHSGHVMSSWLYCAPIGGNVHLTAWFEVRYWGGSTAQILAWIENGWTRVSTCAGQVGTLTFTLNGATRFTQTNVHIANHCRVVAQDISGAGHWTGTAPDLYVAQTADSLTRTKLVPPYFPDSSGAATQLNALNSAYSPTTYGQLVDSPRDGGGNSTNNGGYDAVMSSAGYHAGIGPLPEWDVFYLTSAADKRAYNAVIANSMGYGRYGVHFRDELTLRPFSPADGPQKTLPQGSNHNIDAIGANQTGPSEILPTVAGYDTGGALGIIKPEYWKHSHHPASGFLPYLLTGHEFFVEACQFLAGTCFLRMNNLPTQRDYGQGLVRTDYEEVRGHAWTMRTFFQAATISPDGSALQSSFVAIVQNNIALYHATYSTPGSVSGSYGVPRFNVNQFNQNPAIPKFLVNGFEIDFSVSAWGYGLSMSPPVGSTALANMRTYFNWHAQWPVVRLGELGNANTYGFNAAARANSHCVAPSFTDAPWTTNTGWYSNPGQMFQDIFEQASGSTSYTGAVLVGEQVLLTVAGTGSARDITVVISGITGSTTIRLQVSTTGTGSWTNAATYTANTGGTTFNDGLTGVRYYRLLLEANNGATITASLTTLGSNANNTVNTLGGFDAGNGNPTTATSYWANFQLAIGYAVEHEIPGAWDGFLRMIGASNWSTLAAGMALEPVGSVQSLKSPPAWRVGLTANTFVDLASTQFYSWNQANLPAGAYRGTDPIGSPIDAFCDPGIAADGDQIIYGGGHGDGTNNGVVRFNARTLAYSQAGQPTPPSKYLPSYNRDISHPDWADPVAYPSGVIFSQAVGGTVLPNYNVNEYGWHRGVAEGLNATTDAAYLTTLARATSHMYGAACVRGDVVHYFYLTYGEFNYRTGQWGGFGGTSIPAQLVAIQANLLNTPLQQGTYAIYDEVTDRFVVTLTPGDFGPGTRRGVFFFNPVTRTVESVHLIAADVLPSSPLIKVGRKAWLFRKVQLTSYNQPHDFNNGIIIDLDTKAITYFTIEGNPSSTGLVAMSSNQETCPAVFDGSRIVRWNYDSTNRGNVHFIDPTQTPVGGSGTSGSPYRYVQTSRAVSSAPSSITFVYHRFAYVPSAQAILFIPRANSNYKALYLP